jgi:hypothetical protein
MQVVRSDLQRHSNDGVVLMEGKGTTRCRKGICIRVAIQLARDSLQQWKTTCEKTNHGAGQHQTWFLKALTKWCDYIPSPLEAETLGLKEVMLWLVELGLSKVQIELDCKLVVDCIVDRSKNQSEFGNIMFVRISLLDQYPNFKISYIRRQTNFVVHTLARVLKLYVRHHIFDLISSCVTSIVMNEII